MRNGIALAVGLLVTACGPRATTGATDQTASKNNEVSYADSSTGVIIDLGSGSSWDGRANQDLRGISDAIGSGYSDDLRGSGEPNVLDGAGGTDLLKGGDEADTFVFHAHEANGDTIVDFSGQQGDRLELHGYGTAAEGASITKTDATHWSINSADGAISDVITLANGANIGASDYNFEP